MGYTYLQEYGLQKKTFHRELYALFWHRISLKKKIILEIIKILKNIKNSSYV